MFIPVWKIKPVWTCKRKYAENGKFSRVKNRKTIKYKQQLQTLALQPAVWGMPGFAPISLQWFSLYVSFSNTCKVTTVTHTKRIDRNLLRKETSFVCYTSSVLTLRLQVIEIYSNQLLKYNWIDFSSKQRSFYFTKSSRGQDPTTQGPDLARGPYVWHPCS